MFKPVKLLGEIMVLAYLVNDNTEYCVILRYAGHVNQLRVQIFPNKEHCVEDNPIHISDFYLNEKLRGDPEEELLKLKATLENCLFPNVEKEEITC